MNKQVLISNLEVIKEQLVKAENAIGREYAEVLEKTKLADITKEEFYYETLLIMTMDAIENLTAITTTLEDVTPKEMIAIAEEEGQDFKEISREMKAEIITRKLHDNPILGALATISAMLKVRK